MLTIRTRGFWADADAMPIIRMTTNLIVRTPMGGGRGYGPTHSQTLDRHFLGVPGLRIVALNSLTQAAAQHDNAGSTRLIEAIRAAIKERTNVWMTVVTCARTELPEFNYKARRWKDERQEGYRL